MVKFFLKIIILFGLILMFCGCDDKEESCCTCKDCPQCDVCCDCHNPYLNK